MVFSATIPSIHGCHVKNDVPQLLLIVFCDSYHKTHKLFSKNFSLRSNGHRLYLEHFDGVLFAVSTSNGRNVDGRRKYGGYGQHYEVY